MTKKIFKSMLLVAFCVLLAAFAVIMGCLYEYFARIEESRVRDELYIAAAGVEQGGEDYLAALKNSDCRFTWVAADGTVIYDTRTDAAQLENHADREEIRSAMTSGAGESIRYSSTLLEKTIYAARKLPDGSVLRASVSGAAVGTMVLGMLQPALLVLLAALLLSALLAKSLAKRVVEPLKRLNLDDPLSNENAFYDELAPMLGQINRQRGQINMQLRELKRKTDEFEQITGSMREGLVLLDEQGYIISMNPAAMNIFGASSASIGSDFLTVDRSTEMSAAIRAAMDTGHGRLHEVRGGLTYQFDLSRIDADDAAAGAVLLAFDITEQENAEKIRREFTANVSHELKTPLQGIIGSAELIENGMVKQEDMPRFVGHIRSEAQRLVTLVNDIIRLSQLDEGGELPKENVELLDVAREAAEDLRSEAEKSGISVEVRGAGAEIHGVRRLLYEIIFNLCDNAIKYNREGGQVTITAERAEHGAKLTVEDTGIGIAPEDQGRIFERFYRVDKSHSKASGGTGLGLSIVKHAVQYHGGTIAVESELGKGTKIILFFPEQ